MAKRYHLYMFLRSLPLRIKIECCENAIQLNLNYYEAFNNMGDI